jgi:hypothetical protein
MRTTGKAFLWALMAAHTSWAQDPDIANIHIQGDGVRLIWSTGMDRYIVEQFNPLEPHSVAVGSSSGVVDTATLVPMPTNAQAFFRLRSGLQAVRLSDTVVEATVRSWIGGDKMQPTNWIYDTETAGLTNLSVALRGVSSLTGLAGLGDLAWFDAGGNQIHNLSGLSGMTGLQVLRLDGNQLGTLDGLGELPDLRVLDISHNQISDLAPLSALPQLEVLYADHNQLSSVAGLADVLNLTLVDLSGNQLTDITPLLTNADHGGIGPGDTVYLSGNSLLPEPQVAALRDRGVTVVFP